MVLKAVVAFVAHLVNQQVCHEITALELLTMLLEKPTDDSVEVAVDFVKEPPTLLPLPSYSIFLLLFPSSCEHIDIHKSTWVSQNELSKMLTFLYMDLTKSRNRVKHDGTFCLTNT